MEQRPGYEPPKEKGPLTQRVEDAARRLKQSEYNRLKTSILSGNATDAERSRALRLAHDLGINPTR